MESKIPNRILKYLEKNKEGNTIRMIAKEVGTTPATCSKYVLYLETKGLVKVRKLGKSHLVVLDGK